MPYEFPFIDDGVDWNCFHWYIDLKESGEREGEKRKISSSQSSRQQQPRHHHHQARSFWLHHHYTAASSSSSQVPSHSKLAKWVTVASQVFNKRQEKGTRWVHDEMGLIFRTCLKRKIRIEYTWYWECVLLLPLCSCMKICIIDWL